MIKYEGYEDIGYLEDDKIEVIQSNKSNNFIVRVGHGVKKHQLKSALVELLEKLDD